MQYVYHVQTRNVKSISFLHITRPLSRGEYVRPDDTPALPNGHIYWYSCRSLGLRSEIVRIYICDDGSSEYKIKYTYTKQ